MSKSGSEPYRLSYDPGTDTICAMGPDRVVFEQAGRMPGAKAWNEGVRFISVPRSRGAFLAFESLLAVEWCSDSYVEARNLTMTPDPRTLDSFYENLRRGGGDPSRLLPYQAAAGAQAFHNGRGLLNASEPGTGKTRTTLASLVAMGAKKTLVVAPKTVCVEWAVEAKKADGLFGGNPPFYSVTYADGPIAWRGEELAKWFAHDEPAIVSVNYEALPELWPYLRKAIGADAIDSLIVDESHWIKSPKTAVAKTVAEISKNVSRCFCGSGTPIGNEIGDLHQQVDAVAPGLLASNYHEFMGRYAVMSQREIYVRGNARKVPVVVGARDLHDLMVRMDPIWFRASKAAVLDLPPKSSRTVCLPLPKDVRALYEKVKEEGDAVFDELSLSGALVRDLRLSQICAGFCPRISRNWDDPPETGGMMVDVPSPKIDWLKAYCRDKLAGDPSHRVVIWCRFTHSILRVQKELEKTFGRPGRVAYVIGGTPWTEEAIQSMNSKDPRGVQIIVAQPKAIGTGKQLQGCDTMIFFDNGYSHIARTQAEARMERLGRSGGMEVIDLVALGTIDEDIKKALDRKEDFAELTAPDTTFR